MVTVGRVSFERAADAGLARLKHRVPQFFTENGWPYVIENRFLRSKCKRLSLKSIATVAEQLKEYLEWRELNNIAVEDISETNFEYYIDAQCSHFTKNGKPLAWNTVNSRIGGAHRFVYWCVKNNYNAHVELEYVPSRQFGDRRYKTKGHPRKKFKEPTKFLLIDDALEFIRCLGERSSVSGRTGQRNRLIAKLMLQCGLRISEAVNFPLADLPEIITTGHSTPARIIGKGEKPRVILIPNRLLADLWAYADITRARIIEVSTREISDQHLFLSEYGRKITINWIEKLFARAGASMGLHVVPHVLRHTYGSYHYIHNKDLVFLARLMGHEDPSTTEKFYVHVAKLISYTGNYEQLQVEVDNMCAGM